MELLENYIFVPLDIFKVNLQNRGMNDKLDAWLAFLSVDDPEWILKIIEAYPEFKVMYDDVYEICMNVERVMGMFSKELLELDKNTVQYMIDEMQDEINQMKADAGEKDAQLLEKDAQLLEQKTQLAEKDSQILEQKKQLEDEKRRYQELEARLKAFEQNTK